MNAVVTEIEQWWHDLISHLFKHPNAPTVAPAAIQAVANVAAQPSAQVAQAIPPDDGVTGKNGVRVLWKDYAGQLDRQAFPAITLRIGRGLTDAEAAAGYAAGIVKSPQSGDSQPASDHSGFDFGTVPSGNYLRNTIEGGKTYSFAFNVASPTKLRLVVASDLSMGKPVFDNFSVTVKSGEQIIEQVSQPANTGATYIAPESVFQPGAYTMLVSVDKTDLVILQWNAGA